MRSIGLILILLLSSCGSIKQAEPIADFTKIEIMELGGITGGIPMRIFYPDGRMIELGITMKLKPESRAALKDLVPQIKALRPVHTGIPGEVGRSLKLMTEHDTLHFSWYLSSRDSLIEPHDAIYRHLSSLSAELVNL